MAARPRPGAAPPALRPDLSAGDLLRAAAALGVQDAASLQQLAGHLGLARRRVAPASGESAGRDITQLPRQPRQPLEQDTRQQKPRGNDPALQDNGARRGGTPGPAAQARLSTLPRLQAGTSPPAWLAGDGPALARGQAAPVSVPDPLFSPQTTRALGAAVAGVQAGDGDLDLDRLVTALAAREPPRSLPRQPAWTLRRGLQVLVDTGPGMQPCDADVQQLLAVLQRLLGADRLVVQAFEDEPLQGCRAADDSQPGGWQRPAAGVPVLLLSDMGIARPAGQAARPAAIWRPFLQAAALGGHPVRALLPFAPARWPAGLAGGMALLCWDRRTTVAAVRRLLAG